MLKQLRNEVPFLLAIMLVSVHVMKREAIVKQIGIYIDLRILIRIRKFDFINLKLF